MEGGAWLEAESVPLKSIFYLASFCLHFDPTMMLLLPHHDPQTMEPDDQPGTETFENVS